MVEDWLDTTAEEEWAGCYKPHKWDKLRAKESIKHPAKMANGLLQRIFQHLLANAILKIGDTVLDPMGGIGTTAIGWCAMHPDNKAITVELEDKFIEFQKANKRKAEEILNRKVNWTIIKGDARELSKILDERGLIGLTSPPHGMGKGLGHSDDDAKDKIRKEKQIYTRYGDHRDQIGNLPDKPVTVISPPYANRFDKGNEQQRKREGTIQNEMDVGGYSDDPNNIGNLKDKPITILSPPYADSVTGVGEGPNVPAFFKWAKEKAGKWPIPNDEMRELSNEWQRNNKGYSSDPENIGNLKDRKPVTVTSPPYPTDMHNRMTETCRETFKGRSYKPQQEYGRTEGQIGNLKDKGKTYLDAMLQVYHECSKVCRCIVTVTKNPTRKKKLRRLDLDTKKLLEAVGFAPIIWIKARLFDIITKTDLKGNVTRTVKGRMSFFKRLQFERGNPCAQHEDILIGMKGGMK